jgi:hypothetical protein
MPRVAVDQLQPGWYVLNPISDDRGNLLLAPGVQLKGNYIERLRDLGLPAADVTFAPGLGGGMPSLLSGEVRIRATRSVAATMDAVRLGAWWDPTDLHQCVWAIVREVQRSPDVLIGLSDIRPANGRFFSHSVAVCAVSVLIGQELGMCFEDLVDLGVGALLHDIGLAVARGGRLGYLSAPGRQSLGRLQHPRLGYQALTASRGAVSSRAALVALEHHEAVNGAGYPAGIGGKRISEFGAICAAADLYDNLSSDHAHRSGLVPSVCVSILHRMAGRRLRRDVADALIRRIALYPEGSLVRLNDGHLGVIARYRHQTPEFPDVLVIADEAWAPLPPALIHLSRVPNLNIVELMTAVTSDLSALATWSSQQDADALAGDLG